MPIAAFRPSMTMLWPRSMASSGATRIRAGLGEGRDVPAPQRRLVPPRPPGRRGPASSWSASSETSGGTRPAQRAMAVQVVGRPAGLVVAAGEEEQPAAVGVGGREVGQLVGQLLVAPASSGSGAASAAASAGVRAAGGLGVDAGEPQRLPVGAVEEAW